MDSLKEKTAKGLLWSMFNNTTTQILNLLFGIYLARLLSPADYGLVGVLTIFTTIAGNLQSCGFTQALTNMRQPTANDYNSVFWFNILTSITIYVILFFSAPLIALYFRQSALVELSRFVFLAFVISSFGIAHSAYMFKNMMVKQVTVIGVVALLLSGITGIVLAFRGKAYWSIAWQQVVYITVLNIGRYYYTPWRPSLHIDFRPVKRMFRFSVKLLFTMIINTVSNNILTFIFGRLFPIHVVGNFTQAYKWNTMASSLLSGTVGQVAQPMLAEINDDKERERRVFRKMMRFTAFLSFPAMFGLGMVSREFILVTIHERWIHCVPLLRVLCVSGAFLPFYTMYQNLMISRGRSDIYLRCNIVQIVLQIALVIMFAHYGINTMVVAYTLFYIAFLAVWQHCLYKLTRISLLDTLKDLCPFMLSAAAVMLVVYWLTRSLANLWLLLGVRIVLAAVLYAGIMKLARVKMLDECIAFIRKKHVN